MTFVLIALISFIASFVRSTLGFGESLIAVPLFLFFLPAVVAVPLSIMISVLIALIIVIQDYQKIYFGAAKWLIFYALLGLWPGIMLLIYGNEMFIKLFLGGLIIFYAIYSLVGKPKLLWLKNSKLGMAICGFLSGVFGGAYGLNGPPLVIYGNSQEWSAPYFRATLQAYFLVIGIISLAIYYYKGLINMEVNQYFLYAFISIFPATFLGGKLNARLSINHFYKIVYWVLIIIGLLLILNIS